MIKSGLVQSRYQESFEFLQARKRRQVKQLVLLNNLQRGDQNIASTLLLTLFNRTLSALYDDRMQVKFLPSQGITQDQINSYNTLAQSDYLEMGKARIDYDWDWDALFFGKGFLETIRFDKKRKILQPHVINPLVFGYDPYFENPREWRYYWKWLTKPGWEIEKLIKAGVITGVKNAQEIAPGVDPNLWDYKILRDEAKKAVAPSAEPVNNDVYQILEFFYINDKGKKSVCWTDKMFAKVLMEYELDLGDGEEIVSPDGKTIEVDSDWPVVVKEAFREPHSSVNFSIADLLEDKHRAKSVLLNLAYIAAKDKANPLYGYNPDKVRDVTQFFSRQINQHIAMDDETAAWPLNKEDPMSAGLISFIQVLTQEANEPVGTGTALQPDKGLGSETATEVAIEQQLNDMAQSLQSKVMQFGEQEFWSHWFHRYRKNADALGEKMANIVGVKGVDTKMIDLSDFKTKYPPGVMVYSAKEAEYKELVLRRDLITLYPNLQTSLDPDGLRNFNKHVFFPKFLHDPSLIDIMLPKTLDEIKAETENEQLKAGVMVDVIETDEDTTHLYTHRMINPKTWEAWFHMAWHERQLAEKKKEMQAQVGAMQPELVGATQGPSTAQKVGTERRSPLAAASPLQTEVNAKDNIR